MSAGNVQRRKRKHIDTPKIHVNRSCNRYTPVSYSTAANAQLASGNPPGRSVETPIFNNDGNRFFNRSITRFETPTLWTFK